MNDMRPTIFIGSAKESVREAKKVQSLLENDFDCLLWTEGEAFKLNKDTMRNLKEDALGSDYAIFIGGKDDEVLRKGESQPTFKPRDNVYLECGLFSGIISPERTFVILNKDCKIASDMLGITIVDYEDTNPDQTIEQACNRIRQEIETEELVSRITLLPSTSLALGYRENFLKRTLESIKNDKLKVKKNGQEVELTRVSKKLKIVIPDCVDRDWKAWAEKYGQDNGLVECRLESPQPSGIRGISVMAEGQTLQDGNQVVLIDVPQTMRMAFEAVDLAIGKDSVGKDSEKVRKIKRKEVENFKKVIRDWIRDNSAETWYEVEIVHVD